MAWLVLPQYSNRVVLYVFGRTLIRDCWKSRLLRWTISWCLFITAHFGMLGNSESAETDHKWVITHNPRHLVLNDMMKPRPVLLIRALWLTACTLAFQREWNWLAQRNTGSLCGIINHLTSMGKHI